MLRKEKCMNEIEIFKSEEFGEIRTIIIDGEPWFVAKDVCDILGTTNPTMAMEGLEDFERTKFNLGRQGKQTLSVRVDSIHLY